MTIEIEAGASQHQCSMKSLFRPSYFERGFLDPFVVKDAFPAPTETTSGNHPYYGTLRTLPGRMRVLGTGLVFRPIVREASLPINGQALEPLDGCSTMRQDVTHVRED
jgi:hypothetical protein